MKNVKLCYYKEGISENEICAPAFSTGDKVVVLHYPIYDMKERITLRVNNEIFQESEDTVIMSYNNYKTYGYYSRSCISAVYIFKLKD